MSPTTVLIEPLSCSRMLVCNSHWPAGSPGLEHKGGPLVQRLVAQHDKARQKAWILYNAIQTRDVSLLDLDANEHKSYARGIG